MAGTNGRVLIYGESGTGKELVAHALHALSPRAGEPFVEVNCAAIPEELIESEMFGHIKGSFTSAHEDKIGKFQKADGGTLFLDEVGDMSLRTQAKVLRALEEQRFEPVGAERIGAGGCARGGGHQQEPGGGDRARQFPRGPVLPAERDSVLRAAAARPARGYPAAGRPFPARVHHRVRAQAEGADAGSVPRAHRVSLAGECAGAEEPDRADRDSESAGAGGRTAYSVTDGAETARSPAGALRQSAGSARGGRARVHPQEAGRDQRECHADGGACWAWSGATCTGR